MLILISDLLLRGTNTRLRKVRASLLFVEWIVWVPTALLITAEDKSTASGFVCVPCWTFFVKTVCVDWFFVDTLWIRCANRNFCGPFLPVYFDLTMGVRGVRGLRDWMNRELDGEWFFFTKRTC